PQPRYSGPVALPGLRALEGSPRARSPPQDTSPQGALGGIAETYRRRAGVTGPTSSGGMMADSDFSRSFRFADESFQRKLRCASGRRAGGTRDRYRSTRGRAGRVG